MLDMHTLIVFKDKDTEKVTQYTSGSCPETHFTIDLAMKEIEAWKKRGRTIKRYDDLDYNQLRYNKSDRAETQLMDEEEKEASFLAQPLLQKRLNPTPVEQCLSDVNLPVEGPKTLANVTLEMVTSVGMMKANSLDQSCSKLPALNECVWVSQKRARIESNLIGTDKGQQGECQQKQQEEENSVISPSFYLQN